MICALLGNVHRDPKKIEAFTVEDFLPSATEEEALDREKADELMRLTRAKLSFSAMHNQFNSRKRK